jgi:UDP-N-acetylmuramate dehydrogenase
VSKARATATATSVIERAAAVLGGRAQRDVAIGPLTTYRVGGAAALFVTATSVDDLAAVARAVGATGVPVLVVGKGSNLLVADAGFPGVAVMLGEDLATVDVAGTRVRAGGAAALPVVARRTVREGLTGFEWAVGVPGSIGGAVRMNAGGHGSDMAASLVDARVVDLATGVDRRVPAADLALGYRRSAVAATDVVVDATLGLAAGHRATGERTLSEIVAWRRANQPGGQNAGSVFTNPPGDSAGRLIDAAGCKGLRIGSAEVSTKHANFFQADAGGSAGDVVALMREVRGRVRAHAGVDLHPETRLVGFDEANPQPQPQPRPRPEVET